MGFNTTILFLNDGYHKILNETRIFINKDFCRFRGTFISSFFLCKNSHHRNILL